MNQIISTVKKYTKVIEIDLKTIAEYRYELVSQIFILPVKTIFLVLLWNTIFEINGQNPFDKTWTISYFVIVSLFDFLVTPFCAITYELMQDVKSGNLDIHLTKPYNYFLMRYLSRFRNILFGLLLIIIYTLIADGTLFSYKFLYSIYYFIVSTIILFLIFSIFGLLSFIVENVLTFRDNIWNIIKLFSGSIVPLSFYPNIAQIILSYLPFKYIYSQPILIILNNVNKNLDLALSFLWILFLLIVLEFSWRKALQHYSSHGG